MPQCVIAQRGMGRADRISRQDEPKLSFASVLTLRCK